MKQIPKAELHLHYEGSMTPALARKFAQRHSMSLPDDLFIDDETYRWTDFLSFLNAYDTACSVIKTFEDYRDIAYDYLERAAAQGTIYVEMMTSPLHAEMIGLSYQDHLAAAIEGIEQAKADFDIEARLIVTGVRQLGAKAVEGIALNAKKHPNPYVVGFGLGGDEANFPPKLFQHAYEIAGDAGLRLTAHAGEAAGPESIRDAIDYLKVERLGHGVRIIEDEKLLAEVIEKQITFEVCPMSNIALKVFDSLAEHPFKKLFDAGASVTLSSDDPPFFKTSIGNEYDVAKKHFGLSDDALLMITKNAIQKSFADDALKLELLQKCD